MTNGEFASRTLAWRGGRGTRLEVVRALTADEDGRTFGEFPMQRLKVADYFPVAELPVAVWAMPEQRAMPLHRHEFAELTSVTAGAAAHLTAQGR